MALKDDPAFRAGASAREAAAFLGKKLQLHRPAQAYHYAKGKAVGAAARAAGAPLRAAQGSLAALLLGPKALGGPMRGKRLRAVAGGPGKGLRDISLGEYLAIKGGDTPGKVYKGQVGRRPYLYARKYRPGGAVGMAMKHPILAGLTGLGGYYLLKKPEARAVAGAMPGMMLPSQEINAALAARLRQQPSIENPLAREVWQ